MKMLILITFFFSTSLWACPDKTKRFWVEPEGTIRMEACLSAEPYAVTVYKMGEVVFSRMINDQSDLKKIEKDLGRNEKLKKYAEIGPKLNESYDSEIKIQKQLIMNQLSILGSLNRNLNLGFQQNPCPEKVSKTASKKFMYQDLSCNMEFPQEKIDLSKDLKISLHSDLLQADKALFSEKTTLYTIEVKNKEGQIINRGKCRTFGQTQLATIPSQQSEEALPSLLTTDQSTISLDLYGNTKMPLDYTIKQNEPKDDKKSLDLGLSMGLSRDFELPSRQKMNISTGVEMPILHGVESAQDVFNRDRFSLDPDQVTFKFQVHMKF